MTYTNSDVANNTMAIIFTIGLLIVYIPQYYKIIKMRSSIGFSTWFIFLGQTASWLSAINASIYYIPEGYAICRQSISGCIENQLGLLLLVFQWFLYWIQYVLFIKYYPKPEFEILLNEQDRDKLKKDYRIAKITFIISHVIILSSFVTTLCLLIFNTQILQHWGDGVDLVLMVMYLVHYIPQIVETIKLRTAGSISLISLGIMTPGSFLWTYFLATQMADSIEIWVPYLLVAVSQFCLLILCLYFEFNVQIELKIERIKAYFRRPNELNELNSSLTDEV